MKYVAFVFLSLSSINLLGQNSSGLALSKGMLCETEIVSYKTPLQEDAVKWIKMKPAKKAQTVIQFNADIAAGKIAPGSKSSAPTKIDEQVNVGGSTQFKGSTRVGAYDYKLTIIEKGDSIFSLLNDGQPFPIPGKNNDTTGIWCYGKKQYPKVIEVGDVLPGFMNEMNLFPYDLKTSRREFFNFSGGDGWSYSGFVNVRKTRNMQINSIILNSPFYVVAKEELEISGKKYTAFKLLNEQWTKTNVNTVVKEDPSIYFEDKGLSDKIKANLRDRGRGWDTPERKAEILEKMQSQSGLVTNEQGYQVNLQENWFVPELGMVVKSRFFDGTGALQMESRMVSIK